MLNKQWLTTDLARDCNTFISRLSNTHELLQQACINPALLSVGWPATLIAQLMPYLVATQPQLIQVNQTLLFATLPLDDNLLLIGPLTNPEILKNAHQLTLTDKPFSQLDHVPYINTQFLLQLLLNYFNLTHSIELTQADLLTTAPFNLDYLAQKAYTQHTFEQQESQLMHNSYLQEIQGLNSVTAGDIERLIANRKTFFRNGIGLPYQNNLRNAKNLAISVVAVVCRAAIKGGIHFETAFSMSDHFIAQIESLDTITAVVQLARQIEVEYTLLVHQQKQATNPHTHNPKVEKMKQFILSHQNEPVTLQDLAKYLNSHENYLSALFKRIEGQTITAYILATKIEYNQQLLIYTAKPISEIAAFIGFSSQSYFSHVFKKATATTPNQYRKANTFQ